MKKNKIYLFLLILLTLFIFRNSFGSLQETLHGQSLTTENSYIQGADPFVYSEKGDEKYLYSTNRESTNIPVYKSLNNNKWKKIGDALPNLPPWASSGFTWAPEVTKLSNDKYIIFFTARNKINKKQCIGRAFSDKPYGPYEDYSNFPLICDSVFEAMIDPSPFKDKDGSIYLLWKTRKKNDDGKINTAIFIAKLSKLGSLLDGSTKKLIENDLPWEGKHVEAPSLLLTNNKYILFYSAGNATTQGYSVNFATSNYLYGPYTKSLAQPILTGNSFLKGPGHQSITREGNNFVIYYHSVFSNRKKNNFDNARYINKSFLCISSTLIYISDEACQ